MTQKGGASLRFSNRGLEAWRPAELPTLPEASVSKRLQDRVAKLMHNIEAEMDKIDEQIGTNMQICDLDGDGMVVTELNFDSECFLDLTRRTGSCFGIFKRTIRRT